MTAAIKLLQAEGFDNVHAEEMTAPRWNRGEESLTLYEPRARPYKMAMLGLGSSIGTGPDGITAEVIVVRNETDLANKAAQGLVRGKIVLYNWYCDWHGSEADAMGRALDCVAEVLWWRRSTVSPAHCIVSLLSFDGRCYCSRFRTLSLLLRV